MLIHRPQLNQAAIPLELPKILVRQIVTAMMVPYPSDSENPSASDGKGHVVAGIDTRPVKP